MDAFQQGQAIGAQMYYSVSGVTSLCCFPLKLSHNKLLTHGGPVAAVNLTGNFPSDP